MLIELTRIDGSKLNINIFQIEMVERKNNTVIKMSNGILYVVLEYPEEINKKIRNFIRESFFDIARS